MFGVIARARRSIITPVFCFLSLWRLFQLVSFFLTLHNNYRINHHEKVKQLYDDEELQVRKTALNEFYTERFGPKETRHATRYYSVPENKNFDDATIRELYKETEQHDD